MRVLGVIPARGGSKGVPGKNIKLLAGKPLIYYTIEASKRAGLITETVVSTDSEEIAEIAKDYGAEVPFLRPPELATDTASSVDVVIHAVEFLKDKGKAFDAVCLLQPTYPFREDGFIDKAVKIFMDNNPDSLISVLPLPDKYNPHWIFEKSLDNFLKIATGEKEIIKRRQDLPDAFYRDGSVYITRTDVLINEHSLYGGKIGYIVSDISRYVNIDTIEDWDKAGELAERIKASE
jgi:CMP-N,N'-diacetyllegionaminic acid synthase